MSDFPTANFSGHDDGLFSVAEIRALMEAEFDRALRYQYPLVFMAIVVDRLEHLQDLYGIESKSVIVRSVTDLLQSVSRSADFLGCLSEDRILVLLPYTTAEGASAISRRLLSGARALHFDGDGHVLQITVSVGAAHNGGSAPHSYEDLVRTAEEALAEARTAGGDRHHVREAGPPPAPLRRRSDLVEPSTPAPAPAVAPQAPDPAAEVALFDRIREYLVLQGDLPGAPQANTTNGGPEPANLEHEIVSSVLKALQIEREATRNEPQRRDGESDRRMELLERRLSKLSESLTSTERTLHKIAGQPTEDAGLASIYRGVQGLQDDEPDIERKREMMSQIFQANLDLQSPPES